MGCIIQNSGFQPGVGLFLPWGQRAMSTEFLVVTAGLWGVECFQHLVPGGQAAPLDEEGSPAPTVSSIKDEELIQYKADEQGGNSAPPNRHTCVQLPFK